MRQTRFSKQRELIYNTLMESVAHPSAEMIYHSLKSSVPSLSLGTVYRNLNLLVEEGRAVLIPSTVNRYDGTTREHPHFVCTCCDAIYDLRLPLDLQLDQTVEQLGHRVSRHDLIFKGICSHCLTKSNSQRAQESHTSTQL